MHPDHARPAELTDALTLVFRHLRDEQRQGRVAHVLSLLEQGDLDARGVFVLRDTAAAGVEAALLCSHVAGGGSLIWPPVSLRPADETGEGALIARACAWLREGGAALTQCLLPADEEPLAAPLLRNGFRHVTDLHYLCHDLSLPGLLPSLPPWLRFEPYDPDDPVEFHETLERTYQDTLDCPEVNGLRGVEEVVRGHKAQGRFDPSYWWLARVGAEPAGVLLLMEQPEVGGDWDVGYVGVIPAYRGRGIGRQLMLQGLCEVKAAGGSRVTLSVDRRNVPARALYDSLGFDEYDRRLVILAVWR